ELAAAGGVDDGAGEAAGGHRRDGDAVLVGAAGDVVAGAVERGGGVELGIDVRPELRAAGDVRGAVAGQRGAVAGGGVAVVGGGGDRQAERQVQVGGLEPVRGEVRGPGAGGVGGAEVERGPVGVAGARADHGGPGRATAGDERVEYESVHGPIDEVD